MNAQTNSNARKLNINTKPNNGTQSTVKFVSYLLCKCCDYESD